MEVRPELLKILRHSLGLQPSGAGHSYRNHYSAGGDSVGLCKELEFMGLMAQSSASDWLPERNFPVFVVTEAGMLAAKVGAPTVFDTEFTDGITCPHCGHVFGDSWEYGDLTCEEIECEACEKPFIATTHTKTTYCTRKDDDDAKSC
jgi:hypothetical protein